MCIRDSMNAVSTYRRSSMSESFCVVRETDRSRGGCPHYVRASLPKLSRPSILRKRTPAAAFANHHYRAWLKRLAKPLPRIPEKQNLGNGLDRPVHRLRTG